MFNVVNYGLSVKLKNTAILPLSKESATKQPKHIKRVKNERKQNNGGIQLLRHLSFELIRRIVKAAAITPTR
jgi:hypothetical protein